MYLWTPPVHPFQDPWSLTKGEDPALAKLVQRQRLVVGLDGPSWEIPEERHGLLTAAVLKAVAGGADVVHRGNQITAWELEAALLPSVLALSEGEVKVRSWSTGDDFALVGAEGKVSRDAHPVPDSGASKPNPRRDYALLFATNDYDDPDWEDLTNPVFDAEALSHDLEDRYGFVVDVVRNATFREMKNKLEDYQHRNFGPQDQLLVFVAGHGQYDETTKEGWVVACDSQGTVEPERAFTHSRLRNAIDGIGCERILVLLDVCFGGTFDQKIALARGGPYAKIRRDEFVRRQLSHRSRLYIASGGKEYISDGEPGHHSPFAWKVLDVLRNPGNSHDGIVTSIRRSTWMSSCFEP
jgi:hypothetical protein